MSKGQPPWWADPLFVYPALLLVLLAVFLGPQACEALGVQRP